MKTTLIILTLMCNAISYGQTYIDSVLSYGNFLEEGYPIDSIWVDSDSTHFIFKYNKNGIYYMDTTEIIHYTLGSGTLDMIETDSGTIFQVRKMDTIRVLCQVIDTTHEFTLPDKVDSVSIDSDSSEINYWVKGKQIKPYDLGIPTKLNSYFTFLYSVREQEQLPDCSKCWPSWKHLYYLDANNEQLSKNIVVFNSIEVK